jgi:hypothetical protein
MPQTSLTRLIRDWPVPAGFLPTPTHDTPSPARQILAREQAAREETLRLKQAVADELSRRNRAA